MPLHAMLYQSRISDVFFQAWKAGYITRYEHTQLINVGLVSRLNEEDRAALHRLSHAIKRGWLEVID